MKYGGMKMLNLNGNTQRLKKNIASQKQPKTCWRPVKRIHTAHGHWTVAMPSV